MSLAWLLLAAIGGIGTLGVAEPLCTPDEPPAISRSDSTPASPASPWTLPGEAIEPADSDSDPEWESALPGVAAGLLPPPDRRGHGPARLRTPRAPASPRFCLRC